MSSHIFAKAEKPIEDTKLTEVALEKLAELAPEALLGKACFNKMVPILSSLLIVYAVIYGYCTLNVELKKLLICNGPL